METRVCEDVHTEFILSSCYSYPPLLPSPPLPQAVSMMEHSEAVCHTLTTPLELDWLKRFPVHVPPLRLPF